LGFGLEAAYELGPTGELAPNRLDGDFSTQLGLHCSPHDAVGALAELPEQLVAAQPSVARSLFT